jgi:hypothetical protein
MRKWVSTASFGYFMFWVASCAHCQSAAVPGAKQNIQVKVIGARTDSYLQKRRGNFGPVGTRVRVVLVHIQVPVGLELSTSNPHQDQNGETVSETFYTLRDKQGKQYMDNDSQELGISPANRNNVQSISWITKDTPIASKSRKSLRFKVKLYFFKRHSKGLVRQLVGSRWLDIPVKYQS